LVSIFNSLNSKEWVQQITVSSILLCLTIDWLQQFTVSNKILCLHMLLIYTVLDKFSLATCYGRNLLRAQHAAVVVALCYSVVMILNLTLNLSDHDVYTCSTFPCQHAALVVAFYYSVEMILNLTFNLSDHDVYTCSTFPCQHAALVVAFYYSVVMILNLTFNLSDHDVFLLYSKVTSIESTYLGVNSNRPLKKIESDTYLKNVIGMTVDFNNKRIFFSDIQRGDIQLVNFDGTDFTVVIDCKFTEYFLMYSTPLLYVVPPTCRKSLTNFIT
jgi:hypothetical protein